MAKGSRPLPLPGLRGPHHARPPTGQTGRPTLATLPPFGRPTGAYGHRLPHWPPTGPLLAIRGGLPLAKGEAPTGQRDGRGSLWPHGSSSPPLPGHLWPKGSRTPHWPPTGHKGAAIGGRPSHRPSLAIREAPYRPHWPQWDGDAFARPLTYGRPPAPSPRLATYGSLRPTWPSEAFGHLHPHSPHRAIGTPSDGRPPHPPPTGPPLAIPGPPPLPRLSGAVAT